MTDIKTTDASDLRKYRTEIPNIVLEMGLTPDALALYIHLKRTAGQDDECRKGTRRLSQDTGISTGRISEARAELEEHKLINVERPKNPSKPIVVTIVDVWEENFRHFADKKRVQSVNTTRSDTEQRKEPLEEVKKPSANAEVKEAGASSRKSKVKGLSEFEAERFWRDLLKTDPHGPMLKNLAQLLAEENKTGEVAITRVWRELGERYERDRMKWPLTDEAWAYGFEQAIVNGAPNIGYVLKTARRYRPERNKVQPPPPKKPAPPPEQLTEEELDRALGLA